MIYQSNILICLKLCLTCATINPLKSRDSDVSSCNPTGHKAQGFCGSAVRTTIRFADYYSDDDIKTGKIVILGELCEVSHHGEILSSVLSGPITSKHFEQYTDWHNEDFSLFPATITRIKGRSVQK